MFLEERSSKCSPLYCRLFVTLTEMSCGSIISSGNNVQQCRSEEEPHSATSPATVAPDLSKLRLNYEESVCCCILSKCSIQNMLKLSIRNVAWHSRRLTTRQYMIQVSLSKYHLLNDALCSYCPSSFYVPKIALAWLDSVCVSGMMVCVSRDGPLTFPGCIPTHWLLEWAPINS